MSLDKKIENFAKERKADEAQKAKWNKEISDSRIAAKRAAFAQIRSKFERFENTEISDSLRVTYGEWGATIHLKDTTYSTLWTRIWPFRSDEAIFDSKPIGKVWKITAVLDEDEQVQWSVGSIEVSGKDLDRKLNDIEEMIALFVFRQREGDHWV